MAPIPVHTKRRILFVVVLSGVALFVHAHLLAPRQAPAPAVGPSRMVTPPVADPESLFSKDTPPADVRHVASEDGPPSQSAQEIDRLFQSYSDKLPPPATLSEENGKSSQCKTHGNVTYTLLSACSKKIKTDDDRDLIPLVRWARHDDPCLRQIALECIVQRIEYKSNGLVVPTMHELNHWMYYDILASAEEYLTSKHIGYDPKLFDGLLLAPSEKEFKEKVMGRWEQVVDKKTRNFQTFLEIKDGAVTVTETKTHNDPQWPDRSQTYQTVPIKINSKHQYQLDGFRMERKGIRRDQMTEMEVIPIHYTLWLITKDVLWFGQNGQNFEQFKRSEEPGH